MRTRLRKCCHDCQLLTSSQVSKVIYQLAKVNMRFSTRCVIMDMDRNYLLCRRRQGKGIQPGWGVPGLGGFLEDEGIRTNLVDNVNNEVGIDLNLWMDDEISEDRSLRKFPYEFSHFFIQESVRDENDEEYQEIEKHEFILYFYFIVSMRGSK